jgi:tetratricopeptide (TPR) repeat protein
MADNEKNKGNDCLKAGDLEEALIFYTRSIECLPRASLYTNRAIANLKLNRYQEAEQDATSALKLIDSLTPSLELKAYLRRGTAYMKRGAYKTAIEDFDNANRVSVQKLSAGVNQEAVKLRNECEKKIKELEPAPPAERKTRFKIEEVDEDEIDLVMPTSGPKASTKRPIIEVISEDTVNDEDIEEIITDAARRSRSEEMMEEAPRSHPFTKEFSTRSKSDEPFMKEVSSRSIVQEPLMKEVSTRSTVSKKVQFDAEVESTKENPFVSIDMETNAEEVSKESEFKQQIVPNLGGAIDMLAVSWVPLIN